jgi:hypothetical protein
MDIANVFESKAKQLFWKPIDAGHLIGEPAPETVQAGHAYFTIRLCEMYLAFARKLWRQIYPMVHCFTQFGGISGHSVVSPVELAALGDVNLDRLVNLDVLLSGPNPYTGGDVSLIAGLYAVPGHDSAVALINLVSSFAALDPTPIGLAVEVAGLVGNAVESIVGLDQAVLHLGVSETFHSPANPLASGYFAGIAAPASAIDATQLWVVNGRLQKGPDAASSVAYTDHDYMLISIERSAARDDWAQLSELQECRQKLATIAGDSLFTVAEKQDRLAALWPTFMQALTDSPSLTDPDRERIAGLVSGDLLNRLKMQSAGNPFLRGAS